MSSETVQVPLGTQSYEIHIGAGLLSQAETLLSAVMPSTRSIIICDEALVEDYAAPLKQALGAELLSLPGGEASKGFAAYEQLMNDLLALTPDRQTTLIALGGGVIGDLVGFAASTLLRGVPFVQIPTTLLAQVDSSVGGKTGINTSAGKNLVGAFYQPKAVLIDTDTLAGLPERQMRAGYAEIVKYAVLGDADFMSWLEANGTDVLARDPKALSHAIAHCVRMKAQIVEADVREKGVRALLNLGHTFGHALEAEASYDGRLLHGEGVAIGMVMAAKLSADLGMCDAQVQQRLSSHLKATGMPASPSDIKGVDWNADAIALHFIADKKAQGGELAFVLLRGIGEAELVRGVSPDAAREVVRAFVS